MQLTFFKPDFNLTCIKKIDLESHIPYTRPRFLNRPLKCAFLHVHKKQSSSIRTSCTAVGHVELLSNETETGTETKNTETVYDTCTLTCLS